MGERRVLYASCRPNHPECGFESHCDTRVLEQDHLAKLLLFDQGQVCTCENRDGSFDWFSMMRYILGSMYCVLPNTGCCDCLRNEIKLASDHKGNVGAPWESHKRRQILAYLRFCYYLSAQTIKQINKLTITWVRHSQWYSGYPFCYCSTVMLQ